MSANLCNIREKGLNALTKNIGLVDTIRFMRQYEDGIGDYTKSRVQNDSVKEIAESIYKRKFV